MSYNGIQRERYERKVRTSYYSKAGTFSKSHQNCRGDTPCHNIRVSLGNDDNQIVIKTAIDYRLSFDFGGFWKTNKGKNKDRNRKSGYYIRINMNYHVYDDLFMVFPLNLRVDVKHLQSTIVEFSDPGSIKSFKEHLKRMTPSSSSCIEGNAFSLCYDHGKWIHKMKVKAFGGPYRSMPPPFIMTSTIQFLMNSTSRILFIEALSDLLAIIKQIENKSRLNREIINKVKRVKTKRVKTKRVKTKNIKGNKKKKKYRKRKRNGKRKKEWKFYEMM